MDLSHRHAAYRDALSVCPSCGEPMRAEPVLGAEVDVCGACEGLWVDWFAGDVEALAASAEAARDPQRTSWPPANAPGARGCCPRCRTKLVEERHRFADATERDLVADVDLLRCPDCAGAFVPRPSARLFLDRAREPRGMTLGEAIVLALRRLVELVRGVATRSRT